MKADLDGLDDLAGLEPEELRARMVKLKAAHALLPRRPAPRRRPSNDPRAEQAARERDGRARVARYEASRGPRVEVTDYLIRTVALASRRRVAAKGWRAPVPHWKETPEERAAYQKFIETGDDVYRARGISIAEAIFDGVDDVFPRPTAATTFEDRQDASRHANLSLRLYWPILDRIAAAAGLRHAGPYLAEWEAAATEAQVIRAFGAVVVAGWSLAPPVLVGPR